MAWVKLSLLIGIPLLVLCLYLWLLVQTHKVDCKTIGPQTLCWEGMSQSQAEHYFQQQLKANPNFAKHDLFLFKRSGKLIVRETP
ncbi:hypothetical protein [Dongshaea marina]|uniref:hypothetical protein n=1 Tax=Dongshaea marina TaxID=2047966 RepID=UPI000D3E7121|nr:hypothetical protein [Dongshaea marina]